ncbi:glycosyltransferase family 4 protein [Thermoleophilia bacterium SCSIO 60948]|nr:glycosyltransferase family 4 protein [Thermoleophilia bacterium SCSIO 60948]
MRVSIVDPPAYTPPYDRALCAALAAAGADVELVTSRFSHGEVPPAEGYEVREAFYRGAARLDPGRPVSGARRAAQRALKGAEHVRDMLRLRSMLDEPDVVHMQWLTFPRYDHALLPSVRPRLLTPHGWLRAEAWEGDPGRGLRRLFDSMDAIVALSEFGRERLVGGAGVDPGRVRVIPHGAFEHLTRVRDPRPLPPELAAVEGPVALMFGLLRPYKAPDLLIEAFSQLPADTAELWIVGRPFGVDIGELRELAARAPGRVRFVDRFVSDSELPAYFERADLVVLPYLDAEQSGVLYTALAFGRAVLMSAVGGFPEVAAEGAGRLVPPGERDALAAALGELLGDPAARAALELGARRAAEGPYSWARIAEQTLALYRELGA